MKKVIVVLLVVVFGTGSYCANAQNRDKVYMLNTSMIKSDGAAVRATRDLWKRVGDQKEEAWYKLPKGYLATYMEGGVESRYVYDNRGAWMYTLLTYQEKEMPREVRKIVKSEYYDYAITWVKEVRQGEDLAYVVHVENEKEWRDLSVQDGDIRVLKTVGKQ
jgi:hypothetical protein